MCNVFCFNGFNQTAIVLRYSAHIKPRKTIKTIKTENITHKHNITSVAELQHVDKILGMSKHWSTPLE